MKKTKLSKAQRRILQNEKFLDSIRNEKHIVLPRQNVRKMIIRKCSLCDNTNESGIVMQCPKCKNNFCMKEHWHYNHIIYQNIYNCMTKNEHVNELITQINSKRYIKRTQSENDLYPIPRRKLHRK